MSDGKELVRTSYRVPDGSKSDSGACRVWFVTELKRPMLVEFDLPSADEGFEQMVLSLDRFDWNPRMPADTFALHPVPDASAWRVLPNH